MYEAAYAELAAKAAKYVPNLLTALKHAQDPYTRGKIIELLGDAGSAAAVPVLAAELAHADQDVRQWAVHSLQAIGGVEAQKLIHAYRATHPDEFE